MEANKKITSKNIRKYKSHIKIFFKANCKYIYLHIYVYLFQTSTISNTLKYNSGMSVCEMPIGIICCLTYLKYNITIFVEVLRNISNINFWLVRDGNIPRI